jgi:hypothetical protein
LPDPAAALSLRWCGLAFLEEAEQPNCRPAGFRPRAERRDSGRTSP